jgi:hypothetical protein
MRVVEAEVVQSSSEFRVETRQVRFGVASGVVPSFSHWLDRAESPAAEASAGEEVERKDEIASGDPKAAGSEESKGAAGVATGAKTATAEDVESLWLRLQFRQRLLELLASLLLGREAKFRPWREAERHEPEAVEGADPTSPKKEKVGQKEEVAGNWIAGNEVAQKTGNASSVEPLVVQVASFEQVTGVREGVGFESHGTVTRADGKVQDFRLQMQMSQTQFGATRAAVALNGQRIDPLVVCYGGGAVRLASERFAFDLDCDGKQEELACLEPGSGLLALDRNGNGKVDDGSELFGPGSGRGFDELSAFDNDQNGWIDEADEVFAKLVLWEPMGSTGASESSGATGAAADPAEGPKAADPAHGPEVDHPKADAPRMAGLLERDVGAIFLGNLSTKLGLRDSQGAAAGQLKRTGTFLQERGGAAGVVQEMDYLV